MARKGVGVCSDFVGPPTNITGGERAVPPVLSRSAPSPDRPPSGAIAPHFVAPPVFPQGSDREAGNGAAPPLAFKNPEQKVKPRRGKDQRGGADDSLANWPTLPQPPQRGGMAHEAPKFAL